MHACTPYSLFGPSRNRMTGPACSEREAMRGGRRRRRGNRNDFLRNGRVCRSIGHKPKRRMKELNVKYLDETIIEKEYGFLGGMVHANCCSVGVPPLRTQQASAKFIAGFLPMAYDSGKTGYGALRESTRGMIAQLINAKPEEIAYTKNTTEGISILASGYPLGKGDNVVVCDLENAANLFPWINASRTRGYEVRLVKTDGRSVTPEELIAATDPQTKIVTVSAVQAGTGCRVDLAALGQACRERGILLCVDGIQAIGRLNIDVSTCNIDYLSCGGYKGLLSGFGIGFLYCREPLIKLIAPCCAGSGTSGFDVEPPEVIKSVSDFTLRTDARRFEGGTTGASSIAMLQQSLSLILELGIENVQAHVLMLEKTLRAELKQTGLDVLPSCALSSGMVVIHYAEHRYEDAEDTFARYNISFCFLDMPFSKSCGSLFP